VTTGPAFVEGVVRVRVPATSANLGPGFDSLGLASGLHDDLAVRVAEGGLLVDVHGEGAAEVPLDERHLVVRSMRSAFDVLGGQPPGLELVCANTIPHSRGLGSSAAAIVSGIVAARALVVPGSGERPDALDGAGALALAAELEGHPDNVAACLLGGLTVAWTDEVGSPSAVRVEPSAELLPVLCIPPTRASTEHARSLLPASVPHRDAAANAGRAALLMHALTARPDLLLAATEDRLHQAYRASAMPATARLLKALRSRGVPAVVSGAGPAVLALPLSVQQSLVDAALPEGWVLTRPGLDLAGAVVLP
jgi:homoserine kinase